MVLGITKKVAAFIERNLKRHTANEWLDSQEMKLYVRKGLHFLEDEKCVTLDLPSFEVYKKGQGTFTTLVQELQAINPWDAIYVECVHNARLRSWLERHGFQREGDSDPGNYYLMVK